MTTMTLSADERLRRRIVRLLSATHRKQVEFAAALNLTQSDISRRLAGKIKFKVEELDDVARFFNLTVAELWFDEWGRFDRRKGADRRQRGDRRKVNAYAMPHVEPQPWEPAPLRAIELPDEDEEDETRPA